MLKESIENDKRLLFLSILPLYPRAQDLLGTFLFKTVILRVFPEILWRHNFIFCSKFSDCHKFLVIRITKSESEVAQSCPTLCDPMDTRLLCPWDSPGKNTEVACHFLLQGIFPTQGSNLGLQHCRQMLYRLSHQGSGLLGFPGGSDSEESALSLGKSQTGRHFSRDFWAGSFNKLSMYS